MARAANLIAGLCTACCVGAERIVMEIVARSGAATATTVYPVQMRDNRSASGLQ